MDNTRVYKHIQYILHIQIIQDILTYTVYTNVYKHIRTFQNTSIYEHIQIILTIHTRSLLYERGPPSSSLDYTNVIQTYTDNIQTVFVYVCIIHQYTNYTNRQNYIRTCKTADGFMSSVMVFPSVPSDSALCCQRRGRPGLRLLVQVLAVTVP